MSLSALSLGKKPSKAGLRGSCDGRGGGPAPSAAVGCIGSGPIPVTSLESKDV